MEITEYPLFGRHMSGRIVRVRDMTYEEVAAISIAQNKIDPGEGIGARVMIASLESWIVGISEPTTKEKRATLTDASWKKVTAEKLEGHLADYFRPKDISTLQRIFDTVHFSSKDEVDAVMGEAKTLAE